jgi:hypothetical protein
MSWMVIPARMGGNLKVTVRNEWDFGPGAAHRFEEPAKNKIDVHEKA